MLQTLFKWKSLPSECHLRQSKKFLIYILRAVWWDFLISGHTIGFYLNCLSISSSILLKNSGSTNKHPDIVLNKIKTKKLRGNIWGISNLQIIIFSFGVAPKKVQGKFCLIHDLFYPASNSVTCTYNTLISLYYKVSYDSVETIIKIFEQFGGASLKLTAIWLTDMPIEVSNPPRFSDN